MKRQVEIYNNYKEKKVINVGMFHQWGVWSDELDTGASSYTTAIVELKDGTIETPEAGLIRFIK